ncbi:hypothetical protein AADZ90_006305 [Aestuariibius sp. 2305UL40-4]|uniref:hypothetical protein n=1 Tax=Aestuariibius violaceus TaxID=3234132 RepID=UPI00345EE137
MSRPQKYDHIDFVPPGDVAEAAEKGLKLRDEFGRGGTDVGVARARDLKNKARLTPDTIERMVSYFARHEVDKSAEDFGNDDDPSAGYIAWLLWGGDPGKDWAEGVKDQMEKADAD